MWSKYSITFKFSLFAFIACGVQNPLLISSHLLLFSYLLLLGLSSTAVYALVHGCVGVHAYVTKQRDDLPAMHVC